MYIYVETNTHSSQKSVVRRHEIQECSEMHSDAYSHPKTELFTGN
jgi:hypothetical protein